MRELTFDLVYERGVDEVSDAFIDYPEVELTSLACFAADDRTWRLDRVSGPAEGVSTLETAMTRGESYQGRPGVSPQECYYEVLTRDAGECLVYSRYRDGQPPRPIPTLAIRHFDEGVLFRNERAGERTRWRVVVPNGASAGQFCEQVRDSLGEGVTFDFSSVRQATGWPTDEEPAVTLSPEQRAALEAAVERGYYELPREIELDDLAEDLDVPRSTLSYRLRRAEAQLAEAFLGH